MILPARGTLGDLFELGSKTVALRDDLWCAFDVGLPLKLRVLAELADTADAIASGLRPWAGTCRVLAHGHREMRETTSRLVTAVHHVELASEQIVAGLVTHGRRPQPEAEGPDWDRRLAAAASKSLHAAGSLLAQVPAACIHAVESLAPVLPPADNATAAVTAPAGRLSPLQYAVLREVSLGTVSLSKQAGHTYAFCDGNLHVTRATTNSLESRGLVRREVNHTSFANWRLHLTKAGHTSLLTGLAVLQHSPPASPAQVAAVRSGSPGRSADPSQQRRAPSR